MKISNTKKKKAYSNPDLSNKSVTSAISLLEGPESLQTIIAEFIDDSDDEDLKDALLFFINSK